MKPNKAQSPGTTGASPVVPRAPARHLPIARIITVNIHTAPDDSPAPDLVVTRETEVQTELPPGGSLTVALANTVRAAVNIHQATLEAHPGITGHFSTVMDVKAHHVLDTPIDTCTVANATACEIHDAPAFPLALKSLAQHVLKSFPNI